MRGESFRPSAETPARRPKARVEKRPGVKGREAAPRGAAKERGGAEAEMQRLLDSIHLNAKFLEGRGFSLTVPPDAPKKAKRK